MDVISIKETHLSKTTRDAICRQNQNLGYVGAADLEEERRAGRVSVTHERVQRRQEAREGHAKDHRAALRIRESQLRKTAARMKPADGGMLQKSASMQPRTSPPKF